MPPEPNPVALRIELLIFKPLVWRRIVVANQWTFARLHDCLKYRDERRFSVAGSRSQLECQILRAGDRVVDVGLDGLEAERSI